MSTEVIRKRRAGTINPELLYTADGLMQFGRMKRKAIVDMRQAGVKPHVVGGQLYYDGAAVKRWILSQKQRG